MAEPFLCTVATPDMDLYTGQVYYAGVPGADGSFGVMRGHQLMVATNGEGILKLNLDEAGNDVRTFLVYHGATQMFNNVLTVCARFGIETTKIDPEITKERIQIIKDHLEKLQKELEKDPDSDTLKSRIGTTEDHLTWYELQDRYNNGEVH